MVLVFRKSTTSWISAGVKSFAPSLRCLNRGENERVATDVWGRGSERKGGGREVEGEGDGVERERECA